MEHFTYLLANPEKITAGDLMEMEGIISKYPYFQSARALQLKGLKTKESFRYNDALKLAAAHTTDRDILFEYITSEKFLQNQISKTILQHDSSVLEIMVEPEDVSETIRQEKELDWKIEREKADAILNPDLFQRKIDSVSKTVTTENQTEKKEESQILQKPLEFTKNDTYSFSEWLKLTKAKPIERSDQIHEKPTTSADNEKERKFKLIDKFIQERPKITSIPVDQTSRKNPEHELNALSTKSTDSLMTETLARVYWQQKNYKKAIQAYKILILKNPEKSGFFADQIRAIEKLINSEQS